MTNYAVNQPSYRYTTETTEFDDALIRHGIVTQQQALIAKGATPEQAQALLEQQKRHVEQDKEQQSRPDPWRVQTETDNHQKDPDDDDDDNDWDDDDDDDDFMKRYREQRIQELQQTAASSSSGRRFLFGQVHTISRPEWPVEVNEASMDVWVIVCLTSTDLERTGCVERATVELAHAWPWVKCVAIPYQSAIDEQWPIHQLPTLFAYRHGKLQHQWIQLPIETTADQLATRLLSHGIGGPPTVGRSKIEEDE